MLEYGYDIKHFVKKGFGLPVRTCAGSQRWVAVSAMSDRSCHGLPLRPCAGKRCLATGDDSVAIGRCVFLWFVFDA